MKRTIITVDTEGHVGEDPVRRLIWGETTDGIKNGVPLIIDTCEEVGARALFFVDIAEAWHYGEDKIASVMRYIIDRGHYVGVHIHPDHMADSRRLFLYEYTYEEQYDIIRKCVDYYERILGKKPVAFRAGKYGANWDTIDILTRLGFKADFSEFYGQKWCGIKPAITGNRAVQVNDNLVEIPTMSYRSKLFNIIDRYDKFDTNSAFSEQIYIFRKLLNDRTVDPIVIFAHSFSFLNWRSHPNTPILRSSVLTSFKKVLKLAQENTEFVTIDDIQKDSYKKYNGDVSVFTIDKLHSMVFFGFKAFNVIKQKSDETLRYYKYGY